MLPLQNLSVLVTVFNKEPNVSRLSRNLIELRNNGSEIIVIDDGSTDNSFSILSQSISNKLGFNIFQTSNNGSAAARNLALSMATKDYFVFLDADDSIDSTQLIPALHLMSSLDVDLGKFPFYKNGILKNITDETKSFKLNDSTNNRSIFMNGLGYWRFIYKTKSVQNKFCFLPTFSQLGGRKFILDDLFWLILLGSSKLKFYNCNRFGFYQYDLDFARMTSQEIEKRGREFQEQFTYFPLAFVYFISKMKNEDYDKIWAIKYYLNYVSSLIAMLNWKYFKKYFVNVCKSTLHSSYSVLTFLYSLFYVLPIWLLRRTRLRMRQ